MRIAFLAPEFFPPWGGVGIYSINLVRELSNFDDMEVHVFTPTKGNNYDRDEILAYFGNRIYLHNISAAGGDFIYNLFFQFKIFNKFLEYHRRYKFHIIHSANTVNMPDVFLKLKTLKIPSLATAHTTIKGQVSGFLTSNKNFFKMAPSEKGSLIGYPCISIMEKFYLKRTRYMITVSHKFVDIFKNQYHYKGLIKPIFNGIDIAHFNYDKIREPFVKFPQLKGKDPIVLYAGRLITQKGLNVFIKSMSVLKHDKVHFVFAGKGDTKNFFKILKDHSIPKGKYTYLGFVENRDLPWLYKLSTLFVLPSFYENLPICLLEAMSMKVPCIATDVGAVDEIIDHENDGLIIETGDFKKLAANIRFLLQNDNVRNRFSDIGCNKIRKQFTAAGMALETKEFYERIINDFNVRS